MLNGLLCAYCYRTRSHTVGPNKQRKIVKKNSATSVGSDWMTHYPYIVKVRYDKIINGIMNIYLRVC